MTAPDWIIPPSTLRWLDEAPRNRPVAMLIRHSVRGHLEPGDAGYHMPLTPDGHRLARELGSVLGARLRSAHASPLLRTMQTSERLVEGAGLDLQVHADTLLGDPGVYVLDDRVGHYWAELGHQEMMRRLVEDAPPLPGIAASDAAARFLVHHMLAVARGKPGIHAFSTHDSLVTATAARLLQLPLGPQDWPMCLEAALFWEAGGEVHVAYKGWRAARRAPLVGLTEADVIGLARREVAATVGLDCPARFFLAGGAFKTLITGRPPRDLDLWAPSPEDRAMLEARLLQRGARPLPSQPYTQAYRLEGRVVELPHKTEPSTLEERLARFDLALSAVGAEYRPNDTWRAVIHPLARESIKRRQVLLLDELPNWKHGLGTLERMRRYAGELGYDAPAEEQERLWQIYEAQPPEIRVGMRERFYAVAKHDQGVAEELACRFR